MGSYPTYRTSQDHYPSDDHPLHLLAFIFDLDLDVAALVVEGIACSIGGRHRSFVPVAPRSCYEDGRIDFVGMELGIWKGM